MLCTLRLGGRGGSVCPLPPVRGEGGVPEGTPPVGGRVYRWGDSPWCGLGMRANRVESVTEKRVCKKVSSGKVKTVFGRATGVAERAG